MKILVSTQHTQGQRKNDFCFVPEDQIVLAGSECDYETVDGRCGCRRSLVGADNHAATTTFKIVEYQGDQAEWEKLARYSYMDAGWDKTTTEDYLDESLHLLREAAKYPVGTVLEKRGEVFQIRQQELGPPIGE